MVSKIKKIEAEYRKIKSRFQYLNIYEAINLLNITKSFKCDMCGFEFTIDNILKYTELDMDMIYVDCPNCPYMIDENTPFLPKHLSPYTIAIWLLHKAIVKKTSKKFNLNKFVGV